MSIVDRTIIINYYDYEKDSYQPKIQHYNKKQMIDNYNDKNYG